MERRVQLDAGQLTLSIEREDVPLNSLCGFASRRNRQRGFLFVSKVLGKHIPVRPADMDRTYARLAAKLTVTALPVVFVGLAETATGLGQGTYEHFVRREGAADKLYLHTTRQRFHRDLACCSLEPHSHAPQHLLYYPDLKAHQELLREACTLVLIDDEISSGTTLSNLARELRGVSPHLSQVHVVCLTNWLSDAMRMQFRNRVGLGGEYFSLLEGSLHFEPRAEFSPSVPTSVSTNDADFDAKITSNYGRFGIQDPVQIAFDIPELTAGLRPGSRILVLGTGEFHYPPFLLARELAAHGFEVFYQSTTRSPILLGDDIGSICEFVDHDYEDVANYVYNVVDQEYDRIFIGYENSQPARLHRLGELLQGRQLFFPGGSHSPVPIPIR